MKSPPETPEGPGLALPKGSCARCAMQVLNGLCARTTHGGSVVTLRAGADEAAARKALADLKSCDCAAVDARRTRLRAAGLDERTAALALVLAQGENAPADARALVADLAERAARAWKG